MLALLDERDLAFLLYEFLDTKALLRREWYAEPSREIFDATLATIRIIAEERFAAQLTRGDAHEPTFDGNSVTLIAETRAARAALTEVHRTFHRRRRRTLRGQDWPRPGRDRREVPQVMSVCRAGDTALRRQLLDRSQGASVGPDSAFT